MDRQTPHDGIDRLGCKRAKTSRNAINDEPRSRQRCTNKTSPGRNPPALILTITLTLNLTLTLTLVIRGVCLWVIVRVLSGHPNINRHRLRAVIGLLRKLYGNICKRRRFPVILLTKLQTNKRVANIVDRKQSLARRLSPGRCKNRTTAGQ